MGTSTPCCSTSLHSTKTVTCSGCQKSLPTFEFLRCEEFEPIGMQFTDCELTINMFYFTHACANCGSTILVPIEEFLPYITEDIPPNALTGSVECGHHCTQMTDLSVCHNPCFYAPFRRFLLKLRADRVSQPKTFSA